MEKNETFFVSKVLNVRWERSKILELSCLSVKEKKREKLGGIMHRIIIFLFGSIK